MFQCHLTAYLIHVGTAKGFRGINSFQTHCIGLIFQYISKIHALYIHMHEINIV